MFMQYYISSIIIVLYLLFNYLKINVTWILLKVTRYVLSLYQ